MALNDQLDLFKEGTGSRLSEFVNLQGGAEPLFALPCGRRKLRSAAPARLMYASPRFGRLRSIAEILAADYCVVSAKHGLLDPDQVIEPYDLDLVSLSAEARELWAREVLSQLAGRGGHRPFILLTTGAYLSELLAANCRREQPLTLFTPFAGLSEASEDEWIEQATAVAMRIRDVRLLYRMLARWRGDGRSFLLRNLPQQKLPERGVYLFLDPQETSAYLPCPRVVRIGTHAVSQGSKATIKNRLRNHLGLTDGRGSHRGSIFRLHVGRAMLEREGTVTTLPSWGVGQHASQEIMQNETALERRVSDYLGALEVIVLPIDDPPSKDSRRAKVETQLISLFTDSLVPIEHASPSWLGRYSPVTAISRTGLWNVRDVGRPYRSKAEGAVSDIEAQLGHGNA